MNEKYEVVKFVDNQFELDVRSVIKMTQCGLPLNKLLVYSEGIIKLYVDT